jgi:hypothetical protein
MTLRGNNGLSELDNGSHSFSTRAKSVVKTSIRQRIRLAYRKPEVRLKQSREGRARPERASEI